MKSWFTGLVMLLVLGGWVRPAAALDVTWACTFDYASTSNAVIKFAEYKSALEIKQNGAKVDGWIPIWCWGKPNTYKKDGWVAIEALSSDVTFDGRLALKNSADPSEVLPVQLCLGAVGYDKGCIDKPHTLVKIAVDSDTTTNEFMQEVLSEQHPNKNPSFGYLGFKERYRVRAHANLARGANVAPGIYRARIQLAMGFNILGVGYATAGLEVTGTQVITQNFQAYVSKECLFEQPRDIDFGAAMSVKQLKQVKGAFRVQCTKNTNYKIKLTGKHDEGGIHRMYDGKTNEYIPYAFYDSTGGSLWSDDKLFTGTGEWGSNEFIVQINNDAPEVHAGKFNDVVTAELTY